MSEPVLELEDVSKDYHGLRPLRIARLSLAPGEQVSLVGFDQSTAEIFVNLVTGASLPDRGSIRLFGRHTADIKDSDDWLTTVDRFGIVSRRSVLLEAMTVVQNLAMPFTLDIEPPAPDVRERAAAIAREVGLAQEVLDRSIVELDALSVFAVRLGRALALNPSVLLFEHPTAEVAPSDIRALAARCRAVAERRNIAAVVLTADREFAADAASRVLTLDPATGRLSGGGWFSRFRRA
ncbi:MAG TPA: ATP-binding cassette domain-containing protein [Vicinamibacterales bacterium]|nr:ATP-binding cassette domain-containing protein [Vicinamibacterales bacterium]